MFGKYKEIILSLDKKTHVRDAERRRKRIIIPIIYFVAETILVWLVLALIQLNFNMFEWSVWGLGIFLVVLIYSITKTVNIFQRQSEYMTEEEHSDLK